MTDDISLSQGLLLYLILLAGVCLHEWAHAYVADKLGDSTPRLDGRTTLNPAAHFDPVGTALMPLLIIFVIPFFAPFGWGKRIILNPDNFVNSRRSEIIVWSAGPVMNLCLALGISLAGGIAFRLGIDLRSLISSVVIINTILLVLNMLPFPPLDAGHILRLATRMREETFVLLSQWSFLLLLFLIFFFPPFRAAVDFIFKSFLVANQMAFSAGSGGGRLFF